MLNFTKRTDELVSLVSLYAELFQHLSIGLLSFKFCFNQIDRFRTKFGMTNFNKRCAFTLSELLLSLIIVGVVAIITVPVLINNVQKKVFATQVKNMVANIEQVAQDELITHRTRDLINTDFADAAKLLSNNHFQISKTCINSTDASVNCWKTNVTGKDKVTYHYLNRSIGAFNPSSTRTIILKNGAILLMMPISLADNVSGDIVATFYIDVNGNDKPNVAGRDFYIFYITNKGRVVDYYYTRNQNITVTQKIRNCPNSIVACFGALADNNWKMDY